MSEQEVMRHFAGAAECECLSLGKIDRDTNSFTVRDEDGNRFSVHVRKEDGWSRKSWQEGNGEMK